VAWAVRSWPIAHQIALLVSRTRDAASVARSSVNVPTAHPGSGHDQVRRRHRIRTGTPAHEMSCNTRTRRPWDTATTPQTPHPSSRAGVSIVSTNS